MARISRSNSYNNVRQTILFLLASYLCQPLDGKPFLNYKQQFRLYNNKASFWGGRPLGKAEFLQIITPIRQKAFSQRIIQDAFSERGIWPPYGNHIINSLTNQMTIPDIDTPEGLRTPSPPALLSSDIDNTPPTTIKALARNQAKLIRDLEDLNERGKRNIERIFDHQRVIIEQLQMQINTVSKIRTAQAPQHRESTKRQVKALGDTGIIKSRDAIRSIADRKVKDLAREKKKLDKQHIKLYGTPCPQRPEERIQQALENERRAIEAGNDFFIDN